MKETAPQTLPARMYRDASLFEIERRNIFARSWLLVAHESQLESVGDYVAVAAAGYPLIVVRSAPQSIHAFHNVCRHRAGPLANDGAGKCDARFVCMYHGWQYDLDGRLSSARDFGPADGFNPADFGLLPVQCERWRGFVFINMDSAAPPFAEFIAAFDRHTRNIPLETFQVTRTARHHLACNWKTYVDNYLETYHIPQVHAFLNSAVDAAQFDTDISEFGIFYTAPQRGDTPVSGLWAWLWPCLSVNIYNDGILMERIWPLSVSSTQLDYLYLFPKGVSDSVVEQTIRASETTTREDKAICEAVQRNLDAGIFETGILSPKHEMTVAWFQKKVIFPSLAKEG